MKEMLDYYRRQGAPSDQTALVGLLKELQQTYGAVPKWAVGEIAEEYKVKESFILAVVKRIPSLRLQDTHLLELEENTGRSYKKIYIVGGGAKNAFLNELTEKATRQTNSATTTPARGVPQKEENV